MYNIEKLIKEKNYKAIEYKKISDLFDLFSGMTGVSKKWAEDGNCKFIDYKNAYNNVKIDITLLQNATVKNLQQRELKKGDILVTSASEIPEECAMSAVIEDAIPEKIFLDDHLFGLRLKEEYEGIINPTFIKYYFDSSEFRKNIHKAVRGVTRFYISNPNFMKLEIPILPLQEQNDIVQILDMFVELKKNLTAELTARQKQYEYYRNKLLSFDKSAESLDTLHTHTHTHTDIFTNKK